LIEYIIIDQQVAAFVLTSDGLTIRREIAPLKTVTDAIRRLRFQLDSQRAATTRDSAAISRTRYILAELYDQLIKPVEDLVEWKNLIFAPTGMLNQIPFHALFDGFGYLVEAREVSYTPSARLLSHCLETVAPPDGRMLIVGVSDQFAPQIDREVIDLATQFPEAELLVNDAASVSAVKGAANGAKIIHFACHGVFRPDNPLFSALSLTDGRLTVREAAELDLRGSLVVLSACESGQSEIRAGDELFGLARGFFAAGAKTMILSQWPVNDQSTSRLMESFYDRLRHGIRPAAALRFAQLDQIRTNQHPFDWAPFISVGAF
jgi:CHAT domain-containing protein